MNEFERRHGGAQPSAAAPGDAAASKPGGGAPEPRVHRPRSHLESPVEVAADFESFYEIESARLFGALCLICGNRHDAEELMQEAFLKVWERWDVVQGLASPTGYLYRTAMNAFRMRRRRMAVAARRVVRRQPRDDVFDQAESRYL